MIYNNKNNSELEIKCKYKENKKEKWNFIFTKKVKKYYFKIGRLNYLN